MQKLPSIIQTGLGHIVFRAMAMRCRTSTPQHFLFKRFIGENGAGREIRTILIAQKYIIKSIISYI